MVKHCPKILAGEEKATRCQIVMTYTRLVCTQTHLPALEARPQDGFITVVTDDPLMKTYSCNKIGNISTESVAGLKLKGSSSVHQRKEEEKEKKRSF